MIKCIWSVVVLVVACAVASGESAVWKVQQGESILYLGATCHLLRDRDYPLPPEFDQAYQASTLVVFETDIAKLQDPSIQRTLMASTMYADGSTVKDHLSPESYGALSAYCASNNIPLQALGQFKPAMLMVTLALMELMKLGITAPGVDAHVHGLATADHKPVEGLETVEEQIRYLVTMADGHEDAFVTYSLGDLQTLTTQFDALVNAWRTGDTEALDALMTAELKSDLPALYERLITARNQNWMPHLDAYLATPVTEFVLVGAGHLVGAEGLLESLKAKGYSVEKL